VSVPAPACSEASARADERLTAEREETKYLVPGEQLTELQRELAAELPLHRFTGEGANRLPDPHHFVTTVYFDTPSLAHYRAACGDVEHNVKVRAKEYYDVHPSLAELATDPAQIVRFDPWIWFELKRRDGAHTSKRRFRLPKRDVPTLLGGGSLEPDALANAGPGHDQVAPALRELVLHCESVGEPLGASAVVNYRRLSFQDVVGSLRVTVDLGLAFYAPPVDLWTREQPLVRSTLGRAKGSEPCAVVEVKRRVGMPSWLRAALERAGVRAVPFSKFVAATGSVHGKDVAG